MSTTDNNPDVNVSQSAQHQEGIDHITANSSAGGAPPAASNPGSDDPSGGIAKDHGGVSGAAFIGSPVPTEQKSIVQSTVETVRSYLPASLAGLSLGGGSSEAKPESSEDQARDTQDSNTSTGVIASAAAATTAATAAVVGGSSTSEDSVKQSQQQDSSSSSSVLSPLKPNSSSSTTEPAPSSSLGPSSSTSTSDSPAVRDEPMADAAPPSQDKGENIVPTKDDVTSADDAPGEGEAGDQKVSHAKKETWPKENRDAIPTAGGERLGEKHWGESDVVPDAGRRSQSQAEAAGVSSAEGQPDSQTKSNTASNTGGATGPPAASGDSASHGKNEGSEGKPKTIDKIKEKLHMGSK